MLILEIDTHSPVPIYEQVADGVQLLVRRGDLVPGSPLASGPPTGLRSGDQREHRRTGVSNLEKEGILETAGAERNSGRR